MTIIWILLGKVSFYNMNYMPDWIRQCFLFKTGLWFDKSRTLTHHSHLFLAPVCWACLSNLKAILFCKSSRHHVIRDTISVPSLQKKANGCNHLCGKQGGCFVIHWVFGWLFASSCPFTHTLRNHIFPFLKAFLSSSPCLHIDARTNFKLCWLNWLVCTQMFIWKK